MEIIIDVIFLCSQAKEKKANTKILAANSRRVSYSKRLFKSNQIHIEYISAYQL